MLLATLLTKNILSALNKLPWQQSIKESSSSKSFSDSDDIRAKGNAFTSTKSIEAKYPNNLFFGHWMDISFVTNLLVFKNASKERLTYS